MTAVLQLFSRFGIFVVLQFCVFQVSSIDETQIGCSSNGIVDTFDEYIENEVDSAIPMFDLLPQIYPQFIQDPQKA